MVSSKKIEQALKKLSSVRSNELWLNDSSIEVSNGEVFASVKAGVGINGVVDRGGFTSAINAVSGEIELSQSGSTLVIKHGKRGRITLPMFERAAEWIDDTKPCGSISGLSKALSDVAFAASTDSLRPVMCGVNMVNGDLVSTDGMIMAMTKIDANGLSINIPSSVAKALLSFDGDCKVRLSERKVVFEFEDASIGGMLLEGKYPNYRSVIPTNNQNSLTVDRLEFLSTLKAASACSGSKMVSLSMSGFELIVSAEDIDFGRSYNDAITAECTCEELPKFSLEKLTSVVASLRDDKIKMTFSDTTRAALFSEGDRLILLMPML